MSLNVISRDILSKAQKEKENFQEALNNEMSVLEQESNERIESFNNDLSSKYDLEFNNSKIKVLGKYTKEAKSVILDTKSKILEEVYSKVLEKINSLAEKEREEILVKLLSLAKPLINFDSIQTSKEDLKFIKSKVTDKIKVSSKENLTGLIFYANDGKEILDLSFEEVFKDLIANKEEEIQDMLFK